MLTANDRADTHSREYLKASHRAGCLICLLSAAIVVLLAAKLIFGV